VLRRKLKLRLPNLLQSWNLLPKQLLPLNLLLLPKQLRPLNLLPPSKLRLKPPLSKPTPNLTRWPFKRPE